MSAPGGRDPEAGGRVVSSRGGWFPAGSDVVTWIQLSILLAVFLLLVLLGGGQAFGAARVGAWGESGRGAAFVVLAIVLGYLTVARMPVGYRLARDPRHGPLLEIRRLRGAPIRLRLGEYTSADSRRVVFAWFPLVSGSRMFGLRGARVEQMLLGFWSFGRDGRRAIVLEGPGRPLTLVSPLDQEGFLRAARAMIEGRNDPVEW